MDNKVGLAILLGVLGLILGGLIVYAAFPREVIKTTEIEVPVEKIVKVEKVVNITTEVSPDYKAEVVAAYLKEAATDKAMRKCDGEAYDIDEISVKKVYDGFVVKQNSDGDLSTSDVKFKLNFDDGECYRTVTCGLDAENEIFC
jgi:hypothetical protein